MVQIVNQQSISLEQFQDATPAERSIVAQMNSILSNLSNAVAGNLDIGQNVIAQLKTINYTTTANYIGSDEFRTLKFPRTLKNKASFLFLGKAFKTGSPFGKNINSITCNNWQDNNGQIEIYFIPGLEDSTQYTFSFFIF